MIFFYGLTSSKGCVCIIHISFIITLYRMCSEKNKIMMTFYLYWTIQNNNETWFDITCILKYRATYWTCTLIAIFDKIWFFSLNHLKFWSVDLHLFSVIFNSIWLFEQLLFKIFHPTYFFISLFFPIFRIQGWSSGLYFLDMMPYFLRRASSFCSRPYSLPAPNLGRTSIS